ncbi:hypothetical protein AOLI_G00294570 [Acnodon oligacanthus]
MKHEPLRGGLQTQQLLSSAGQLAVRSWRERSSLIGALSTACWPRSPTPNPSVHVFTRPSLISTQDGTFYSLEEPGQGEREMKMSAGLTSCSPNS